MKQGSNTRGRPRGRVGGGGGKRTPNRNQTFDSNGPSVRLRGNALQLVEKYTGLARDAGSQGDRVLSENYLQHADHYHRVYMALTGQADGVRVPATVAQNGNRAASPDRGQTEEPLADADAEGSTASDRERPSARAASRRGNGQDRDEARDPETGDEGGPAEDGEDSGETQVAASSGGTRSRSPRRSGRGTSRTSARATVAATGDDDSVGNGPNGNAQGTGAEGEETGAEEPAAAEAGAEADAADGATRTRRIRRNPRRASASRGNGGNEPPEPGQPTAEPSVA